MRAWFEAEDFIDVDCAQLQVSPGNEVHLHGFATERQMPDGSSQRLYLHTSPEFACKKLLAAGETRIFDFARVFRNREADSPLHANEFTMLEWYRVGEDWQSVARDTIALAQGAAATVGAEAFIWRDRQVPVDATPVWVSLAEAFERFAGIDLLATLNAEGTGDRALLAAAMTSQGIRASDADGWSALFNEVLVACVEPALARIGAPVVLHDYPLPEAALARAKPDDRRLAERFEVYICGVELANGFGELNDPVEQRARFQAAMAEQQRLFGESLPLDEDLLAALSAMPAASGVALGFERLVMLVTGARSIDQVRWTP